MIDFSDQSIQPLTSLNDPKATRTTNPYRQLIEHLRNAGKTKDEQSDASTHNRIQQFLSFLHSLNNTTDPLLDEHTLINLFSVDNHLSSSIYIPMNIQQLNKIPKSILHSLETSSENEDILNQVKNVFQ